MGYSLKDLNNGLGTYDPDYSLSKVRSAIGGSGQISLKEFVNEKDPTLSGYITPTPSNWTINEPGTLTVVFDKASLMSSSGSIGGGSYVGSKYHYLFEEESTFGMYLEVGKNSGEDFDDDYNQATTTMVVTHHNVSISQRCVVECDVYDIQPNLLQNNFVKTFEKKLCLFKNAGPLVI